MPTPVLLNSIDHQDLRIITNRGAEWGDQLMWAATLPAEFRDVQACYPIVFRPTSDGPGFEPVALFGFQDGENLFLKGDRWDAPYVPLMIERQPFLIGINGSELMVNVDLDHPRVSRHAGEAVFKPHGGHTEFLERVNSLLLTIHQGMLGLADFIQALTANELLESFAIEVELNDGSRNRLEGFYTINEDRLQALSGDSVAQLHAAGHLRNIYMVLASLSNFRMLIDRKNALLYV